MPDAQTAAIALEIGQRILNEVNKEVVKHKKKEQEQLNLLKKVQRYQ